MGNTRYTCPGCGTTIGYKGLCWRCKEKEKYAALMALTDAEVDERVAQFVRNIEALDAKTAGWREVGKALDGFEDLLAYHDINTTAIAEAACDKAIYSPWLIYRDASERVRDRLIKELVKPDCTEAGDIQAALAVIGGDAVCKVFAQLEHNPLPWRDLLHVNPSIYAEAGGWTFDESGQRETLVFDTCYALHADENSDDAAVQIARKRDNQCDVCGCQMIDMLVVDGHDGRLSFLGLDGTLRVTVCPWCVCFTEENVIRYNLDGTSTYTAKRDPYFAKNELQPRYIDEMDANRYVLDAAPSPTYRSYGEHEVPTIGGMANWIQDWVYLTCPDCGKPMMYLASIPWDCISDGFEGTLYLEICTACQVVGALHQQT